MHILILIHIHIHIHTHLPLYPGNVIITGRESTCALYSADLASMDIDGGGDGLAYNPLDAQGFICINAVRLKANAIREKKVAAQL